MTLPVQGPVDPFRTQNRLDNQNALAGHVEEQAMTEHAFKVQHMTQHILGFSANPSIDPTAPRFVGDTEAATNYGGATVDTLRAPKAVKREFKRKRDDSGDLEVVDGPSAYVGPWGGWAGDIKEDVVPEGYDEGPEESEPEQEVESKKKKKRGYAGQESSIFHGKQMADYQGRTYMHPPLAEAPHLTAEYGSQETFIPKACIHTWTGHTQGVSVIRLFPETGHLLLSGSMDTKIKVGKLEIQFDVICLNRLVMGRIYIWSLSPDLHGPRQGRKRCDVFKRWSSVPFMWLRPANETLGYRDRPVYQAIQ